MNIVLALLGIGLFFGLVYLLLIMPRIVCRPDMRPFQGSLYAHRGLHDNASEAPENSMAAFRKAVESGYGIELDIQLTKDGEVVVFHDFTLERVCGAEGKVCDYTYEELQQFTLYGSQERIPKFTEVLQLVNGKVPLIVEFKGTTTDMSLCLVAASILQEYQGVYCMESFNPLMVAWYRKHQSGVVRGQLSEKFWSNSKKSMLNFVLQHLLLNFYARPDFIAYNWKNHTNWSRRLCKNLYKITAVAFTIKSEEELQEMQGKFDLFIFDSFVPQEKYKTLTKKG